MVCVSPRRVVHRSLQFVLGLVHSDLQRSYGLKGAAKLFLFDLQQAVFLKKGPRQVHCLNKQTIEKTSETQEKRPQKEEW